MDKNKFPPILPEGLENPEFTFDDPKEYYKLMDRNSVDTGVDYTESPDLLAANADVGYTRSPAQLSDVSKFPKVNTVPKNIPSLFKGNDMMELPDFKNYDFQERLNLLDNLKNKKAVTAKMDSSDMEGLNPANIKSQEPKSSNYSSMFPFNLFGDDENLESTPGLKQPEIKDDELDQPFVNRQPAILPDETKVDDVPKMDDMKAPEERPAIQPTEATRSSMSEAQDQAANLRLLQMIMEGSSELGAGIAGVGPGYNVKPIKTEIFKDLTNVPVENLKNRIAMEKFDPSSVRSKAMREAVKAESKRIIPEGNFDYYDQMSEDQLKEEREFLNKLAERKMTSLDRKQTLEYRAQMMREGFAQSREAREDRQQERIALTNKRDYDVLPLRLENAGGASVTRLRNRVQQADNIFATLGISPSQLKTMSPREIERRLDDKQKLAVTEAAIELNSLLGGSSAPAASTLDKLLLNTGYKKGMDIASFIANKQFALKQGPYLKQILDIAARSSEMAKQRIRDTDIRVLSGKKHLADDPYVGPQFINFINKRNISLDELDADYAKQEEEQSSLKPDEVIRIDPNDPTRKAVFNKKTKQFVRWLN